VTAVAELVIAADATAWERIGLTVVGGVARIGTVRLRFVAPHEGHGIVSWGLAGLPVEAGELALSTIDGVPTFVAAPSSEQAPQHPLGVVGFDHIVVMTSSLERTCSAIEAVTGEPLKRVREAGPIRQGFHRLGEVVVEVVESSQHTAGHAQLWGLVWNVADIHEAAAGLGPEIVSLPKAAVQPGRLISSFRESVGLGVPVAMMSTNR
jgi:hypothetical protein